MLDNTAPQPGPASHSMIQFQLNGRVSFLKLGNRRAVFSEPLQKIFELNETSAYLASCIADKPTMSQLLDNLKKQGLANTQAMNTLKQFVTTWSRAKLISAIISPNDLSVFKSETLTIAAKNVSIQFHDKALADKVLPVFAHLRTQNSRKAEIFYLLSYASLAYLFQDGQPAQVMELSEAAPALKGILTEWLLDQAEFTIALHCAMLVYRGNALLLTGPPGAGKTTLTLALLERGFEYASDDITLLLRDGRVKGVSFAPALKSGAWRQLAHFADHLSGAPVHKRMDGRRVKYLTALQRTSTATVPVKWITALNRKSSGSASLQPADVTAMLRALVSGAHAPGERLDGGQLRAIINMIMKSTPSILHYANATDAARLLEKQIESR